MCSALNHVTRGMTRQLQVQLSFLGMEDDDLFHTLDTGQSAPHGLPVELPSLPVFLQTIGLLLVLPLLVWLADAVRDYLHARLHRYCRGGALEAVRQMMEGSWRCDCNRPDAKGNTAIHHAARYTGAQSGAVVRYLLQAGAKADLPNRAGETALHLAAGSGALHAVEALIAAWEESGEVGAHIDARGPSGVTALHLAAAADHPRVVEVLLGKGGADVSLRDEQGRTVLHAAAEGGGVEVMRQLLGEQHRGRALDVDARDSEGRTALHVSGGRRDEELVRLLVEVGGADPKVKDEAKGRTVLHYIIDEQSSSLPRSPYKYYLSGVHPDPREGLVRFLLEQPGVEVNARDSEGRSPLELAIKLNDAVMAELLMEAPGLQSLPERRGAIRLAADSKDSRDLLLLLEEPSLSLEQVQDRVLSMCNIGNLRGLRRILRRHDLNPDDIRLTDPWTKRSAPGYTPLALAAHAGKKEVVEYLVSEAKASTSLLTTSGRNLLHIVASRDLFSNEPPTPVLEPPESVRRSSSTGAYEMASTNGGGSASSSRRSSRSQSFNGTLPGGGRPASASISSSMRAVVAQTAEDANAVEILRYLVEEAGVDPCQCDWDGQTACDLARAYQRDALAAYLETVIPEEQLLAAARDGDLDTLRCLLETYPHRLTGDVCDRALSRTPLHWAAVNGHLDIVRYLVEEVGVALDLPDGTGGTPVLLALSAGQGGVAVYLEKQREEARLGGGSRRRGSGSRAAGDGGLVATGVARWWSFERLRESKDSLWRHASRLSRSDAY